MCPCTNQQNGCVCVCVVHFQEKEASSSERLAFGNHTCELVVTSVDLEDHTKTTAWVRCLLLALLFDVGDLSSPNIVQPRPSECGQVTNFDNQPSSHPHASWWCYSDVHQCHPLLQPVLHMWFGCQWVRSGALLYLGHSRPS